jgi:hypothetical protein
MFDYRGIMKISRGIMTFCVLSLSSHAYALTYGQAQNVVKELPAEYLQGADHGKICEVLGVEVMKELHPNAEVMNGVVYKKKKMTVGELDLVVVENNVVTDVVEVKCWKNYSSASKKADEQLDRFADYIGRCDVDFSIQGAALPCDIFGNKNIRMGKMSYKDATNKGFNFDLSFTRKEILQLIKDVKSSN